MKNATKLLHRRIPSVFLQMVLHLPRLCPVSCHGSACCNEGNVLDNSEKHQSNKQMTKYVYNSFFHVPVKLYPRSVCVSLF